MDYGIISYEIMQRLIVVLCFTAGLMITPIVFIALDFWAGIRKARIRGTRICSDKMQRTARKMSRYYNAVFAMGTLDCIQICAMVFLHIYHGWPLWTFPLFTLVGVGFTAVIEIKSIIEPADKKERRQIVGVAELAKAIAEHKSDPKEIAEAIAEYLKEGEKEKENENE
ncbi:MAG: hypothetical protein ACTTKJ_06665 [Prevotella koreensis]|uniref:hypothetical protein n=1 Tax=Prevotella koreensis TaxID=2490854 RepID=UPI003F9ECA9F